jgi:hypothetical protein
MLETYAPGAGRQAGETGAAAELGCCSTVVTSELDVLFLFIKSKLERIFKTHH